MLNLPFVMRMFLVGVIVLGAGVVSGQDYPNKPIRIVTGPAGGGSDFTARQIAQRITTTLGQPVVIDNRSGVTQGEVVSKAPPDGYTLFVAGSNVWIDPLLQKTPYDTVRDFSPITLAVTSPNILVIHPSLPVKSVKDLIALAKARPGELNYAANAPGSSAHLAGELFKAMAGVNIVAVPYKGGGPAVIGLLGGQVQLMFATSASVTPHIRSGRVRALAITSGELSALLPGLPTVAASGVPGYEMMGKTGMFAPVKTPAAIIKRLNQEIVRALNLPDVKEKFYNAGVEVVGSSPEKFAATVRSDIDKLGKLIKDTGIKSE